MTNPMDDISGVKISWRDWYIAVTENVKRNTDDDNDES